ncbi:MAG: class I SAM-dependent methyltransferase [Planctomycetes bacterium]|nr:class I SAM-dependent methyltransferase [Planctomycetota bacterium]
MSVFKHFLKWQLGLAQAQTQTTVAERDCLAVHAAGRNVLAEIGVWHGVTTCRLRAVMAATGVLYAVDPYPVGRLGVSFQRRIAASEVGRVQNGRVEWVRKTGAAAARALSAQLAGKLEFIFIDGDHSYNGLREDWEGWAGLVAPAGLVALHDSRSTPTRPIEAAGSVRYTQEVILKDLRFTEIAVVDSLTVLQLPGES